MKSLLAESIPLDPRLQSIRDSFNQPGAWSEFLMVLAVVGFITLVLCLLLVVRRSLRRERHRPQRLFRGLMQALGLTPAEQAWLRRMAVDLRLEHPAMLLLSPEALRAHRDQWLERGGDAGLGTEATLVAVGRRLES